MIESITQPKRRYPFKRAKALAAQSATGNDPRRNAVVNRTRGEAISDGHRRNRSWAREHPGQRDEAWFKREIVPKLDAFSLKEIGEATGLSLAACSRIRAGSQIPHPRHWDGLLALLEAGNRGSTPNTLSRRRVLASGSKGK